MFVEESSNRYFSDTESSQTIDKLMNEKRNIAICSLSSGSCGNSYVVMTGSAALLIDAGISARQINRGLERLGLMADDLSAVFLTHEHADHIKGLRVFMKNAGVSLYATRGTLEGLPEDCAAGADTLRAGSRVTIGDMEISSFPVSHDAAEPVGYSISRGGARISLVIDTGVVTDEMIEVMRSSDILVLEANHDESVLRVGRYPWFLKQRILSETGHLSNEAAATALARALKEDPRRAERGAKRILLAHLSKENNFPEMAETTVLNILEQEGLVPGKDFTINVLPRGEMSPVFEI